MKKDFREAIFYEKNDSGSVRCNLCEHHCRMEPVKGKPNSTVFSSLKKENIGLCGTRINVSGVLYSLNYGKVTSLAVDSVEKKPFYNFMPGQNLLSFGSFGCNFRCPNCQNWEISQTSSLVHSRPQVLSSILDNFSEISPAEIVNQAIENDCVGIAYTFNEPTVSLEFVLDVMKMAKKVKVKNVWSTNGFFSGEVWEEIKPLVDAFNVDLKSLDQRFYQSHARGNLAVVLKNLLRIKEAGTHLEVSTLVIPGISSDQKMLSGISSFIKNKLGKNTPWHVLSFSPDFSWQMQDWKKNEVSEIEKIVNLAKETGLNFVYSDVSGLADTVCPHCEATNIKRSDCEIERFDENGGCFKCGQNLCIRE